MKAQEIKNKKDTELKKLLTEKREELRKARFTLVGSKNPKDAATKKQAKKTIAKIMTELNERSQINES